MTTHAAPSSATRDSRSAAPGGALSDGRMRITWIALTALAPAVRGATDIVTSMVSTTRGNLAKLGVNDADYESVLTKASIVEREGNPQYYTQIARVIENRLTNTDAQTQGKLEMDSTVLYGLNRTGGIPSKEEIADGSNKYNTYAHPGLPPVSRY